MLACSAEAHLSAASAHVQAYMHAGHLLSMLARHAGLLIKQVAPTVWTVFNAQHGSIMGRCTWPRDS